MRYGDVMNGSANQSIDTLQVESLLRGELESGDHALMGLGPVLGYLLASPGQSLITDDLLARMRGMLADIASQLMAIDVEAAAPLPPSTHLDGSEDALTERLASVPSLLEHCFSQAIEAQVSEELERRMGLDQVLSPLMQELIASDDSKIAETAMSAMAAQARFIQARRRMGFSISDLPADLFHQLGSAWSAMPGRPSAATRAKAENILRKSYDESAGRGALMTRLVGAMGAGAQAALRVEHAGLALFCTALAIHSRQPRELAVLSCHPSQAIRLALGLRSAGLAAEKLAEELLAIHPECELPPGLAVLGKEKAAELIGESRAGREGL